MLIVALALLVVPSIARATPVLDQSFDSGANGLQARFGPLGAFSTFEIFQSFTVGLNGTLDHVDFKLQERGTPTQNVILEIVSAATPFGAALASAFVLPSSVPTSPGFVSFDLSGAGLGVIAGEQLALRLSTAQDFTGNVNEYFGLGSGAGGYAGGKGDQSTNGAFNNNLGPNADFDFRTFVNTADTAVPEPATLLLVGTGVAACLRRRASRK
jgi:hypothetical protein